jgi:hypothetical protein
MSEFKPKIIPIDKLYGVFKDIAELIPKESDINIAKPIYHAHKILLGKYNGITDLFKSIEAILKEKYEIENNRKSATIFFEYPGFVLARAFFELVGSAVIFYEYCLKDDLEELGGFLIWALDIDPILKKYKFPEPFAFVDETKCQNDILCIIACYPQFLNSRLKKEDVLKKILKLSRNKKPCFDDVLEKPLSFSRYEKYEERVKALYSLINVQKNTPDNIYANLSLAVHGNIHYFLNQYKVNENTIVFFGDHRENYQGMMVVSMVVLCGLYNKYFPFILAVNKDIGKMMTDRLMKFHNETLKDDPTCQ